MKADAQTEAAVMAVLDEFNNAVTTRNLDKVLDLFKHDPDVFLLEPVMNIHNLVG